MQADIWQTAHSAGNIKWENVQQRQRNLLWPHLFMALYGIGWAVSFDLGFRLYGAEIVSILGLMLLRWRPVLRSYPMLRRILSVYVVWVFAIALSDLVNGTALIDTARNMATPIIGGASLVFVLTTFSRTPSALLTFLAATAISKAILGDAIYGDTFADQTLSWASIQADTNLFKVRIEPFLTPTLLILACWVGRRKTSRATMIFMAASLGYFLLDSRSSGLLFLASALTLIAIDTGYKPRRGKTLTTAAVIALIAYGAYWGYVQYTLSFNPDGHNGKQLLRTENPYNPLDLLFQGRSEWLVIPTAIAEKPFLGWGSWAEDKSFYFAILRAERLDEEISSSLIKAYIPAHSLIGSAWVWSGLLGFASMLWFLRIVWTISLRLPGSRSPLLPAVIFLLFLLFWHYFFSPPMHVRLNFPITLAALIALTRGATVFTANSQKRLV